MRFLSKSTVFLIVILVALGCGHSKHSGLLQKAPGDYWVRTELAFGLSKPGNNVVTSKEWDRFLAQEVTPRFPEGLTVLSGYGQYLDHSGKPVRENCRWLILLYRPDESTDNKIEEIRSAYKKQFQQESVLRSSSVAKVSF